MLAGLDVVDVPFVHFHDDAVLRKGRDLEQDLAALHGRIERLAQIAGDDDAIERSDDPCARELLVDECQLRLHFGELRRHDIHVRRLPGGERLLILARHLLPLAGKLRALQLQLAVVERGQQLPGVHEVAGARGRLLDVAVERRDSGALDPRLNHRPRRDAIIASSQDPEERHGHDADDRQLQRDVPGSNEMFDETPAPVERVRRERAIVAPLEMQDRSRDGRHGLQKLDRRRIERRLRGPLQRQRADDASGFGERDGEIDAAPCCAASSACACRTDSSLDCGGGNTTVSR